MNALFASVIICLWPSPIFPTEHKYYVRGSHLYKNKMRVAREKSYSEQKMAFFPNKNLWCVQNLTWHWNEGKKYAFPVTE